MTLYSKDKHVLEAKYTLTLCVCVCVCLCSLNNIPSDGKRSSVRSTGSEGATSLNFSVNAVDFKTFKSTWNEEVHKNREKWKAQAANGINANIYTCT